MTPSEFKQRYTAAIPQDVPDQLRQELAEFVEFDAERVQELPISDTDRAILSEVGLPRNAPPFLNFGDSKSELLAAIDGFPSSALIGFSGFGDPICLDLDQNGAVVLVNRNDPFDSSRRTVMNRNVETLVQSLCGFAEYRATGDVHALRAEIASVDQDAASDNAWWVSEIMSRRPVA